MTIFSFHYLPSFIKLSAIALFAVSLATPNVSIALPPPASGPGDSLMICEAEDSRVRLCNNNPVATQTPCNPIYEGTTSGANCSGWMETMGVWQQVDGYIVEYGVIDGSCSLATQSVTTSESTMQIFP